MFIQYVQDTQQILTKFTPNMFMGQQLKFLGARNYF